MKKGTMFLVALLLCLVPAFSQKIGGTVKVLGVWGGQELDVFQDALKPFTDRTGIKVDFEGTRDIDAVLTARVKGNNPPDIAVVTGPGQMIQLGKSGKLADLSKVLTMADYDKNFAQGWKDLGTVDGKLYGLFLKAAVKGLIWYNPKTFQAQGIKAPPAAWDELLVLSKKLADGGLAPWSVGIESGAASGWAGTDWLEDIFLRMNGPKVYQDWYNGKLAWTSPEVKKVWLEWGKIVADPSMAYGGKQYINATNFGAAGNPLFASPAKAAFHHQASFIQSFFVDQNPGVKPGVDFDFFGFPAINPQFAKAVEGAADICVVMKNSPQVQALMNYMASAEFQAFWAAGTGALATNKNVSLVFYPDALTKRAADILNKAEIVVFDASDMMKPEMNAAFWRGVVDYVNKPADLDSILTGLEKVRADVYK